MMTADAQRLRSASPGQRGWWGRERARDGATRFGGAPASSAIVDLRVRVNLRRRSGAGHERRGSRRRGGRADGWGVRLVRARAGAPWCPPRPTRPPAPRVLWRLESEAGPPEALVWQRTCLLVPGQVCRQGRCCPYQDFRTPACECARLCAWLAVFRVDGRGRTRLARRGRAAQLDSCALPPYCCTHAPLYCATWPASSCASSNRRQ